ncbi:MAG: TfoX/Sxy family DNA transformation protein [Methylophagaceae bacterium]
MGKKIAGRLNEIGIFCEDELRFIGAISAHKMLTEKYPDETLAVCYYLYSFEGALCDKHWNEESNCLKSLSKAEQFSLGRLL